MPSKTKTAIAAAAALPSIPKELIDQFVTGPMSAEAVTRLVVLRVCDDRTLPPLTLQPGDSVNHDVKCCALGHRPRSVPHSPTNRTAKYGPIP